MTHRIVRPEGWKPAKGYANGILTSDGHLFVGGQIGWTADQVFERHDFIGQMEQALRNIVAVVEAAGGAAGDITRLTWYVTDKKAYLAHQGEVGAVYRSVLGRHFPAMTMVVVAELIEDDALLEIEATAVLRGCDDV
jgi:enamine deaminase RidA (YjgF/YER057c/UK114 family)